MVFFSYIKYRGVAVNFPAILGIVVPNLGRYRGTSSVDLAHFFRDRWKKWVSRTKLLGWNISFPGLWTQEKILLYSFLLKGCSCYFQSIFCKEKQMAMTCWGRKLSLAICFDHARWRRTHEDAHILCHLESGGSQGQESSQMENCSASKERFLYVLGRWPIIGYWGCLMWSICSSIHQVPLKSSLKISKIHILTVTSRQYNWLWVCFHQKMLSVRLFRGLCCLGWPHAQVHMRLSQNLAPHSIPFVKIISFDPIWVTLW